MNTLLKPSFPLKAAPLSVVDAQGAPQWGTYQGELAQVDLGALSPLWSPARYLRPFKRKRWHYTLVASKEVLAVFAIVDLGYLTNAFLSVAELPSGRVLVDKGLLGPPRLLARVGDRPGAGLDAEFRVPGVQLRVQRGETGGAYRVEVNLSGATRLRWIAELSTVNVAPALSVVSPVAGTRFVNVTQKRATLPVKGLLEVEGRRYSLDGALGGTDYTQGDLAYQTAWRWAFASGHSEDGRPLGLNVVEGFNDAHPAVNENALWLGDTLWPLPRVRFHYDSAALEQPWKIESDEGSVALRFEPFFVHREEKNLGVVRSRFAQPLGFFTGTVRAGDEEIRLVQTAGVTERQDLRW